METEVLPGMSIPKYRELEGLLKCTPAENAYIDSVVDWADAFTGDDYQRRAEFLEAELSKLKTVFQPNGSFDGRIAVERVLCYLIGHSYEGLATLQMKEVLPIERFAMFEKAVQWYQRADKLVGYCTDYALRQLESCAGAAISRREAGFDDEIAEAYMSRGHQLLAAFFSAFTNLGNVVILPPETKPAPEVLEDLFHKKEGIVRMYVDKRVTAPEN